MLDTLRAAGWTNYSLFLTDDGLLVGYLETDDYAAAQQRMAGTEVNERWQADMAPYFPDPAGQAPDRGFPRRVAAPVGGCADEIVYFIRADYRGRRQRAGGCAPRGAPARRGPRERVLD